MGVDHDKDAELRASRVTQEQLAQVLFPVGEYVKPLVRQMAAERGLPVAGRRDSQDLCFLADGDYRRLCAIGRHGTIGPGAIVDSPGASWASTGAAVLHHRPAQGLGMRQRAAVRAPTGASREHGRGRPGPELGRDRLTAQDVNWIAGQPPVHPIEAQVKIRYKARPVPATSCPSPTTGSRCASARPYAT